MDNKEIFTEIVRLWKAHKGDKQKNRIKLYRMMKLKLT